MPKVGVPWVMRCLCRCGLPVRHVLVSEPFIFIVPTLLRGNDKKTALGPAAEAYRIHDGGVRPRRYSLSLNPDAVRFASDVFKE